MMNNVGTTIMFISLIIFKIIIFLTSVYLTVNHSILWLFLLIPAFDRVNINSK